MSNQFFNTFSRAQLNINAVIRRTYGYILHSARPKTVILPNLYVPDERDLSFASTGSNYKPPEADKSSKYSIYGCLSRCI